jgi:thiol-disulfide isomerase/thioredoxin
MVSLNCITYWSATLSLQVYKKIFILPLFIVFSFGLVAQGQPMKQARPWLGIAIGDATNGVLVKQAIADTPAFKAGLKAGDVVTAINKIKVGTPKELMSTIVNQGVGTKIVVHFLRDNKKLTKEIVLVVRPDELALLKSKMLNKPAPQFDLEVIGSKKPGALKDYLGKVVILEFWATWCPACRSTHKKLNALVESKGNEIAVLTISSEEKNVLENFVKAKNPQFVVLRDSKRITGQDWTFSAIPAMAVIDKKGVIRNVVIGAGVYLDETIAKAIELTK